MSILSVLGLRCKITMRFWNKQTDYVYECIDKVYSRGRVARLSIKMGRWSSAVVYCGRSVLSVWRKVLLLQ